MRGEIHSFQIGYVHEFIPTEISDLPSIEDILRTQLEMFCCL